MIARVRDLMRAQQQLRQNLDDIVALEKHLSAVELLTAQLSDDNAEALIGQLGFVQSQAHESLVASRDGLIYAPHPFASGGEEITIGAYLIERLPDYRLAQGTALFRVDPQLIMEVYEAGRLVCERYFSLYVRVLGELTLIAQTVESGAGLATMPDPDTAR